MRKNYGISELVEYINWAYFYHAWSVPAMSDEGERLQAEASKLLQRLQTYVKVKAVVEIVPAWSEGDDIVIQRTMPCECGQSHAYGEPMRLPMLRQQTPNSEGVCLCLSDFIHPQSANRQDKIGIFATSVSMDKKRVEFHDGYNKMLLQTLADRLAEAGAERLHEEVRTSIWGYAPHEHLTMKELHQGKYQGIRPAIGYPCLPDLSLNFIMDEIINFKSIGVTLTEHGMMSPHASVSGFMLSLPQAQYFAVGDIGNDQLADYALRRNMTVDQIKKYISCC